MGLTSTFYAALSGLDTSSTQFQVIGNNISNVNTTGFKAQSALFQTEFSQTLSIGSSPQGISGGTNPMQLGLGAMSSTVRTSFSAGSLQTTGINSDLAIEGNGFFITQDPRGQLVYSRDGAFSVNSQGYLVNGAGNYVQGYNVDTNFNLIPGQIGDLSIPEGSLTVARPTQNASINGNLNGGGNTATQGTVLSSMQIQSLVGGGVVAVTLLTSTASHSNPGVPMFAVGDVITLGGTAASAAQVGGADVPAASYTVTATSKLSDLCTFLQQSLGIDPSAALPQPGSVSIVNNAGVCSIQITGNTGTANALSLSGTSIAVNTVNTPFTWSAPTAAQTANGESVSTTFTAYDSLGNPLTMDVTFVKESATDAGQTWRFYVKSPDDTSHLLESDGTVTFGTDGQYVSSTGTGILVNRANTGAVTPEQINLDFSSLTDYAAGQRNSAGAAQVGTSQIALSSQDGVALGTLDNFGVGNDGVITGTFSNGLTKTLGQIALATFANENGLLSQGNSNYTAGPNSGVAVIGAPETMSAGSIQGGSLELSNVDLSTEFVNMITTSTAFSANGRTITTANQMMQELLQMGK
jgi:flagellar hook protein FlgE